MSVVCAIHVPGEGTYIGCDTLATKNNGVPLLGCCKWVVGKYGAFGLTGSTVMIDITLRNQEKLLDTQSTPLQVTSNWCDALQAHGCRPTYEDGVPSYPNTSVLYATPQGVWMITDSISIFRLEDRKLHARGSGELPALGAAYAIASESPTRIVQTAIEAAIALSTSCGGSVWQTRLE